MIEQLLNVTWLAIATGSLSLLAHRRRDRRAFVAVVFALALLFPIISATDDLLNADRSLDGQAFAAVLVFAALVIGLTLLARLFAREDAAASFALAPHTDPRSPPRR